MKCMTGKGDEGRTRVGHLIKGAGEQESLCDGISLVERLRRMFPPFCLFWKTEEKKAEMCSDRWGEQSLVFFFDIYFSPYH